MSRVFARLNLLRGMATSDEGVRYRNKVTIVTGGARGIGRACVELFVKHGSKVVMVDKLEDLGKDLEKSLNERGLDGETLFVNCDISVETDVQKMVDTTVDKFGQIDCVINNAAYTLPPKTLDDLTKEEFASLLDVNVLGTFLVSKYAIKHLRATKGNIINMSSMNGVHGKLKNTAYSVSKAGLIGMTRNIAIDEGKHGVRVNWYTISVKQFGSISGLNVSPAAVDSPMFHTAWGKVPNGDKYKEFYTEHAQFMGRLIQPEEVAKTCLYLATDATYSTGQNILVSGGDELDYGFKHNMEWYFEGS